MVNDINIRQLIDSVSIYCDEDARRRDEFRRLWDGYELKPVHDQLHQLAVDLKLATALVFTEPSKLAAGLKDKCDVAASRPQWWPVRSDGPNRKDLLLLRLTPLASAPLGKKWSRIREAFEASSKGCTLWHDDPALVYSSAPTADWCENLGKLAAGR